MQAAARILEAGGVYERLTEDGVVLENTRNVAGLLQGGPRSRVLTEILVLRIDLNSRDQGWRDANTKEGVVI